MRPFYYLLAYALLHAYPTAVFAQAAPASGPLPAATTTLIETVTFRQGALVTRAGVLTLTAGTNDLRLAGLEQGIDGATVLGGGVMLDEVVVTGYSGARSAFKQAAPRRPPSPSPPSRSS